MTKNLRIVFYSLISFFLIVIHLTFLDLIQISEILPNLIIILITWVTLREGRFFGLFFAFIVGLLFDAASYDVPGTNALTQTVVSFIAGYFYREGKELLVLRSFRFLIILLIVALVHNTIYYLLTIKLANMNWQIFIFKNVIANALYTTVMGIIPLLYNLPKRNSYI